MGRNEEGQEEALPTPCPQAHPPLTFLCGGVPGTAPSSSSSSSGSLSAGRGVRRGKMGLGGLSEPPSPVSMATM